MSLDISALTCPNRYPVRTLSSQLGCRRHQAEHPKEDYTLVIFSILVLKYYYVAKKRPSNLTAFSSDLELEAASYVVGLHIYISVLVLLMNN